MTKEKGTIEVPPCIGCGTIKHGPDHGPVNAYIACIIDALKKERANVAQLEETIRGARNALHAT